LDGTRPPAEGDAIQSHQSRFLMGIIKLPDRRENERKKKSRNRITDFCMWSKNGAKQSNIRAESQLFGRMYSGGHRS
jgi:hypothetical protein